MDAMRELDFPAPMRKELRIQLEAYRDLQQKHAAARLKRQHRVENALKLPVLLHPRLLMLHQQR